MSRQPPPHPTVHRPMGLNSKPTRLIAVALSVGAHLAIVVALLSARIAPPPPEVEPESVTVALVDVPPPAEPLAPPTPAPPSPAPPKTPPHRIVVRPTPPPREARPVLVAQETPTEPAPELSDAQMAGATTADSGPTGRPCDMVRWLQSALRRNAKVQAAVANSPRAPGSRAIMVWNGQWIRSAGEDGAGLAGVREAIMLEIAFAPAACRTTEPMRGFVLISLNDSSAAPRLAVGAGQWRWSDLLMPRPAS
ncbi:MAG TPA: hypothetical protein VL460_05220 [Caulobacteraceae bacterium]|nr:hypothetical protein [Caulobacteraceae bacterium]